jgi:hypothetical protein
MMASENKTTAESMGRSRRRYSFRFPASMPLPSRLLRQRLGVPDRHHAARAAGGNFGPKAALKKRPFKTGSFS